ncbi:MAG: 7-cyano-7-deazaguanine synthase [Nanoarchaeota archaeon]|nr:7-cyano-7-deazaguanine synthase [Nanoarchaeota archaeon]
MNGLLLLSGGIDSPVAGYLMKKRGFKIKAVYFHNEFAGNEPLDKAKRLAKKLRIKLTIVDITDILKQIAEKCDKRFYFILMKRVMYRLAEAIAKKEKCSFLITGENLGQVSSQTLQNLYVINKSVSIPVLRPLIAYDKMEIVKLAEEIGTFDISKGPEMCDILGPKHAATQAQEITILRQERKANIDKLIKEKIKKLSK